jgi:hypothetical protein
MNRRELVFLVALLLAAVIGGLFGDIIGTYLPDGAAKTLFTKSVQVGFSPTQLEFYAISFTIGLMFKINFVSALFVILVVVYFRWWYL